MSQKQQNLNNEKTKHQPMDWAKNIDFNKTIHLVFDTSVLTKNPYYSNVGDYKDLALLAKEGEIELHIPEMVKREYVRSSSFSYIKHIDDIKKAYSNLEGYFQDTQEKDLFIDNKKAFNTFSEKCNDIVERKFVDFFTKCNVNFYAIRPIHHENVWSKYFKQELPFKKGKSNERNRKDIPDAYILEVLLEIQKISGNIIFFCNDDNLRKICNDFEIVTIADPKDFLDNLNIKDKVSKIKTSEDQYQKILKLINQHNIQQEISNFIENYDLIYSQTIQSDYFADNEAYCSQVSVMTKNIDDKEPISWTENSFDLRVNYLTTAILEIPVFKGEDYTRLGQLIDDLNEHYHEVEVEYILSLSARLVIHYDENNRISDMRVNIDNVRVITKKDVECKCSECGNAHYLSYEDLDREPPESYERGMGAERHYNLSSLILCEECGNEMEIGIDIWEYPEGCFNDISYSDCQGCQCEINQNNPLPFGLS